MQTGWNTQADGSGAHIGFGSRSDSSELYAEWEKETDSQYFSYSDGDMLLLPGYDGECVIKAFYRKKRNKKKVKEVLEEIKNVVKS